LEKMWRHLLDTWFVFKIILYSRSLQKESNIKVIFYINKKDIKSFSYLK
jgi:hypothetical protein